jgi:hypothetical protein
MIPTGRSRLCSCRRGRSWCACVVPRGLESWRGRGRRGRVAYEMLILARVDNVRMIIAYTYHLQTHDCAPDESPSEVSIGVSRTADVDASRSCWTADARKSSLLADIMSPWNGADRDGSTNIHELSLKPSMELLSKPFPNGKAVTGLVGLLESPKFMKLFARPLPCARDVFQRSNCRGEADGQSPQARFVPWQQELSM